MKKGGKRDDSPGRRPSFNINRSWSWLPLNGSVDPYPYTMYHLIYTGRWRKLLPSSLRSCHRTIERRHSGRLQLLSGRLPHRRDAIWLPLHIQAQVAEANHEMAFQTWTHGVFACLIDDPTPIHSRWTRNTVDLYRYLLPLYTILSVLI